MWSLVDATSAGGKSLVEDVEAGFLQRYGHMIMKMFTMILKMYDSLPECSDQVVLHECNISLTS